MAAVVDQKCLVCRQRYRGAINTLGLLVHPSCMKPYLVDEWRLGVDYGLRKEHWGVLPSIRSKSHGGRYTFTGLLRGTLGGAVPYEWTAHYLVHERFRDHVELYLQECQKDQDLLFREERRRLVKESRDQKRLCIEISALRS